MNKFLLLLLLLVIAVVTYQQQQTEQITTTTSQSAMLVAIDPTDGSLVRPSLAQRQALEIEQQTTFNDTEKFHYRNTWTVHPDGTKSGVVNPQFLHSIYATLNEAGEIVLHESREVAPQQPTLEVR